MIKMNNEKLFRYNIRTICCVIDSVNEATGETVKLRIHSFINLLDNDPFLGPAFNTVFRLNIRYPLRMKTDDLFPSIDMPEDPVAQIIFVLNLMHDSAKHPPRSVFDIIFKLYGSGHGTVDFINHVFKAPLLLLKVRLLYLTTFSWNEIRDNLPEILFPKYAFRFLTPESLPPEYCINKDRILLYFREANIEADTIRTLSKDIDLYIKNHNTYNPDIFFIKEFLARIIKYGGRAALSAMLSACTNSMLVPYILEADPATAPPKKRGPKPKSVMHKSANK